jgi:hypothetical protein
MKCHAAKSRNVQTCVAFRALYQKIITVKQLLSYENTADLAAMPICQIWRCCQTQCDVGGAAVGWIAPTAH